MIDEKIKGEEVEWKKERRTVSHYEQDYSEPSQTSKLLSVIFFVKHSSLAVWQGSEYAFVVAISSNSDKYEIDHCLIRLKCRLQNSKYVKFTMIIQSSHSNIYSFFAISQLKYILICDWPW